MILSTVQFCPQFKRKEENIEKMINIIEGLNSNIISFPELSTTGYFFQSREELEPFAESFHDNTISHFQKISSNKNCIISFGFAEREKDKFYNSAAVLMPDSSLSRVYRKTHLFYKEKFCFEPGNTGYFIIEDNKNDIKIGIMICYDWRFPEAARSLGVLGADLILCPSNLVTHLWPIAMPARALENKVYLAVANRYGTEINNGEGVTFNGKSGVWDFNGTELGMAPKEGDFIINVEINPKETRNKSFNDLNNIFDDRRPELYITNK